MKKVFSKNFPDKLNPMSSLSKAVIDLAGKLPKGTVKGYFIYSNCIMRRSESGKLPTFVCSVADFNNYVNAIRNATTD